MLNKLFFIILLLIPIRILADNNNELLNSAWGVTEIASCEENDTVVFKNGSIGGVKGNDIPQIVFYKDSGLYIFGVKETVFTWTISNDTLKIHSSGDVFFRDDCNICFTIKPYFTRYGRYFAFREVNEKEQTIDAYLLFQNKHISAKEYNQYDSIDIGIIKHQISSLESFNDTNDSIHIIFGYCDNDTLYINQALNKELKEKIKDKRINWSIPSYSRYKDNGFYVINTNKRKYLLERFALFMDKYFDKRSYIYFIREYK